MTARCPSDLALEEHLLEPASSHHAPHVAACKACRHRFQRSEEEGRKFRRYVYPATIALIEEAAPHGRATWPWSGHVPISAALGMCAFLVALNADFASLPDEAAVEPANTQLGGARGPNPTTGDVRAELVAGAMVPGGAVLDGPTGPEWIFRFCGDVAQASVLIEETPSRAIISRESTLGFPGDERRSRPPCTRSSPRRRSRDRPAGRGASHGT